MESGPETAVRVAGSALRRLHDVLPVAGCPFDWSIETRRERVHPSKAGDPRLTNAHSGESGRSFR